MRVRLQLVVGMTVATGCTPLINHTPRVEPGRQTTITFSAAGANLPSPDYDRKKVLLIPAIAFRQAAGWRPESNPDGTGIEWALEGSLLQNATADVYVQAPRSVTGRTDAGVGVAAAVGFFGGPMAYAQAGHHFGKQLYMYTTQNILWLRRSSDGLRRALWQPTLAVEPRQGMMRDYSWFLTVNIGPTADRCRKESGCGLLALQAQGARAAMGISMFYHAP